MYMRKVLGSLAALSCFAFLSTGCFPEGDSDFQAPGATAYSEPDAGSGRDDEPDASETDNPEQPEEPSEPMVEEEPDEGEEEPQIPFQACLTADASESLPARVSVTSGDVQASDRPVFTRDLFNLFKSHCGGCHVDTSLGGFQVTQETFATTIDQTVIDLMRSNDPQLFMPPPEAGGKPASERSADDPVLELADLLTLWLAEGRPTDVFYIQNESAGSEQSPYLLSEEVGSSMTNIGNCVPASSIMEADNERALELDRMFEQATELPERLEDTDLFTFDAETLARHRTVAFAPGYPLWADNAKKIRFIHVPIGESIQYDPEAQEFDIPDNTRIYKTFLKEVIDEAGNVAYRKVETRLIVARQDGVEPNGEAEINALFGTYAWNDEETEAVLVRDPLRNGKPFRDRLLTLITNEQQAKELLASGVPDALLALQQAGLTRTYAIPGSQRCIQCHMGSQSKSFILGFTPLQIDRRPEGEGGVIEPTGAHELNQLQRLIDYGIITGMQGPGELKLEESEGSREPRNEQELEAQGYMLGNCAHCHNPRGFPSQEAPELKDLLDFWPRPDGGIFQFPLDRMSPRTKRGSLSNIQIPYITPSLYDLQGSNADQSKGAYQFKAAQGDVRKGEEQRIWMLAPWRSLIWRNVDTPFTYGDHYAVFHRMPLNTPGYDCRVSRLLANWMVSIPAKLKEEVVGAEVDTREEQPYVEVKPGESGYSSAKSAAERRLRDYQDGLRYEYCPDTSDIVDPRVVSGELLVPADEPQGERGWRDNVPDRPHWVVADFTDVAGDWFPRRPDWQSILVDQNFETVKNEEEQSVVETVQDLELSESFRQYAITKAPYGLWEKKEGCNFSAQPTIASYVGDATPRWFSYQTQAQPTDPVYEQSPGGAVFTLICSNCHGQQADSESSLSDAILELTGGNTRVANLRDGFFGPVDSPGSNREKVFADAAALTGLSTETWAVRYLAWMALGGTQKKLPNIALTLVGNTPVLGVPRGTFFDPSVGSANMLGTAQAFCEHVLYNTRNGASETTFNLTQGAIDHGAATTGTSLINVNGDAELWERLCTTDNPSPVRIVSLPQAWRNDLSPNYDFSLIRIQGSHPLFWATNPVTGAVGYPSDAPVGNNHGKVVTGVTPDNLTPWCLLKPTDPAQITIAEQYVAAHAVDGQPLPFCPESLLAPENQWQDADVKRWARRGAMNAGLAVFSYIDALAHGQVTAQPKYDECEKLQ